ncbi:hypothetical protein ACTQ54_11465 [Fundicoccus sp. Sow4_H7]|uniref:hypothetical protein n=1 Tax=Fundicoccus sp. Sow4_H7 TaxID=3438784 RepID=UPI003F929F91
MTATTIVSSVLCRDEADGVKESAIETGDALTTANDVDLNHSIYDANPKQYQADRQLYLDRMTYAFVQTGEAGQEVHVSNGSEVLLERHFPYMSDEERRLVLQTTAIDSGYPILDD